MSIVTFYTKEMNTIEMLALSHVTTDVGVTVTHNIDFKSKLYIFNSFQFFKLSIKSYSNLLHVLSNNFNFPLFFI